MADFIIDLKKPVFLTKKTGGAEETLEVTSLEMREPCLGDFSDVSLNEPSLGQMLAVARRCCTNLPPKSFDALGAENLMPIASWIGGFLNASR